MEYITAPKPSGCIFCIHPGSSVDRERLILHATAATLVMLNRYPYTNAHLLVAPRQHTDRLDALSETVQLELMSMVILCQRVLEAAFKPHGFNVGMNLGKAAGAGVDDHLHLHIVPRWEGDTNFMSVLQDVRVIPEALLHTYDLLAPLFANDQTKSEND
jgi:ATP adenylyltransferase